jgi:hypothetical protein
MNPNHLRLAGAGLCIPAVAIAGTTRLQQAWADRLPDPMAVHHQPPHRPTPHPIPTRPRLKLKTNVKDSATKDR